MVCLELLSRQKMLIQRNILTLNMMLDLIWVDFSFPNFDVAKNAIIFGVDNSSSMHIDNKKKGIWILGWCPAQRLHDQNILKNVLQTKHKM